MACDILLVAMFSSLFLCWVDLTVAGHQSRPMRRMQWNLKVVGRLMRKIMRREAGLIFAAGSCYQRVSLNIRSTPCNHRMPPHPQNTEYCWYCQQLWRAFPRCGSSFLASLISASGSNLTRGWKGEVQVKEVPRPGSSRAVHKAQDQSSCVPPRYHQQAAEGGNWSNQPAAVQ